MDAQGGFTWSAGQSTCSSWWQLLFSPLNQGLRPHSTFVRNAVTELLAVFLLGGTKAPCERCVLADSKAYCDTQELAINFSRGRTTG
eukprot:516568-Amphidinium_carterae.1